MSDSAMAKYVELMGVLEQPKFDSTNPHFGNRFASLNECVRVVREGCAKVGGCAFRQQSCKREDGTWVVMTELVTPADSMKLSEVPYMPDAKPQNTGSALTYMRRYCLCVAFGLAAEDDADGELDGNPKPMLTPEQQRYMDLRMQAARAADTNVHDVQEAVDARFGKPLQPEQMAGAMAYLQGCITAKSLLVNVTEEI